MAPRLAALLAVALAATLVAVATTARAEPPLTSRKDAIDAKIDRLQDRIAAAGRKQGVLTDEIDAVTEKIDALQADVDRAQVRLATIGDELEHYRNRLNKLNQIFELQTEKLRLLRQQHAAAEARLNERLVAIYQADDPTSIEVVLSARDFADLLDQLEYLRDLGQQDKRIAARVAAAKEQLRQARRKTDQTRFEVFRTTRAVEVRFAEQKRARDQLVSSEQQLASVRSVKRQALANVSETKAEYLREVEALQAASAEITARIQAAQARTAVGTASAGTPSASGLVWPTSGSLTSGFGWRWGRMHEGIDIAAPSGTPIVAAASGTVIYAGWMSGYGNLVIVDHGGGLATAYGHQSAIAAGNGAQVGQGQVIGYVGNTGRSTGPHLHFEVRVNGSPVDPLGYL